MALVGRRVQAARAETSHGGQVKTVGGTKVVTGPNGNTAAKQTSAGVAHGTNGAAAGKQTKVAVKTDDGVKTAQKTRVGAGAYREKKEYDSDSSHSHDGKHTKGGVAVKQTKGVAKTQNGKVVAGKKTKVVGGKVVYYDSDSDHSHKSHGSHSSKGSHKSHGSKGSKGSKKHDKHHHHDDKHHHHHDDKHKDKHDHDVKHGTVGKTTVVKGPQGNTAAKQTTGVAHHGHNGTTTAGKQTKAAVKTDNGVAAGQKTTVGRFGRR